MQLFGTSWTQQPDMIDWLIETASIARICLNVSAFPFILTQILACLTLPRRLTPTHKYNPFHTTIIHNSTPISWEFFPNLRTQVHQLLTSHNPAKTRTQPTHLSTRIPLPFPGGHTHPTTHARGWTYTLHPGAGSHPNLHSQPTPGTLHLTQWQGPIHSQPGEFLRTKEILTQTLHWLTRESILPPTGEPYPHIHYRKPPTYPPTAGENSRLLPQTSLPKPRSTPIL